MEPLKANEDALNLKAIGQKIEELSIEIGSLAKDGRNTFSKYDYISAEKMTTALRSNCLKNNLSIIPSIVNYEEKEYTNDKGKGGVRSIVTIQFKIIDLETGFFLLENFIGAENDTGGKSLQQAITQCTKYFYFKLFNVTSSDEVDGDSKTSGTQGKGPKKETPPNAPANAPAVTFLNETQFNKILEETDPAKVEKNLKFFSSASHKMKKEYKTEIENHLTVLKNQ